jgi:hypothetical protein
MKTIDWQLVATQTRTLFPTIIQIASYSRNRWILVFEDEPDNFLSTFHPLSTLIRKHKLSTPLIVSVKFIKASLDSYPLEFLDIQSDYNSLYAIEDVLKEMQIAKDDIRLQVERELKSKWLLTRLSSLGQSHKPGYLFTLLKESFTALLPVFKGFCVLGGLAIPKDTKQLIDAMEEVLHTDLKVFRYIHSQKKAPSMVLMNTLFNDYIRLLNMCGDQIDCWKQA